MLTCVVSSASAASDVGKSAIKAGSPTQRAIAVAARALFEEKGYERVSIREIAASAGVDPALVMRHYRSKEELFVRVIGFDEHFAPRLDGPLDTIGYRLAAYLLDPRHAQMRRTLTALLYASGHDVVRTDLQGTMQRLLVDTLSARLEGDDRTTRAWLVSAQLLGLTHSWDAVDGGRVSAAERTRVAALYGAAIQQLITPD